MIDHVGIRTQAFARARDFYQKVLEPLGFRMLVEFTPEQTGGVAAAGFGADRAEFWIATAQPLGPGHVAFQAPDRKAVHAFHQAALLAGGKDNGPPGPRPHYNERYYGAFVLDPDGNNIEAVTLAPA